MHFTSLAASSLVVASSLVMAAPAPHWKANVKKHFPRVNAAVVAYGQCELR